MNIRVEGFGKEGLHEGLNRPLSKNGKLGNNEFKGMTLKEYFRLSSNTMLRDDGIRQTDEQDNCSSKVPTPSFNEINSRHKIKTQVEEHPSFVEQKNSYVLKEKKKQLVPFDHKTKNLKLVHIEVELPKRIESKYNKHKKRMNTLGSCHKEHLNRSTITSFYQLEDKKKRMLEKVKHEKERANDLKLTDAFFITKYAEKFRINPKHQF